MSSGDRVGLLMKDEVTYGVDAAPTQAANGVRVADKSFWTDGDLQWAFENLRDDAASGDGLPVAPGNPEGRMIEFGFGWEVRGRGSAYTAVGQTEIGAALKAGGFDEAYATGVITFPLNPWATHSATAWLYFGNKLIKVTGVRGDLADWTCNNGEITVMNFRFQGLVRQAVTEVTLPAITYNTQIPPAFVSAGVDVNGYAGLTVRSAQLAGGREVVMSPSANAPDGIDGFDPVRGRPSVTLDVRATALANYNPYTTADNRSVQTIDWTAGASPTNRAKLDVNAAYLKNPAPQDQDGLVGNQFVFDRVLDAAIVFD